MESLLTYTDLLHLTLLVIILSVALFIIFYIIFIFIDRMHEKIRKIDYINGKIIDYSDNLCSYNLLIEIPQENKKCLKKTFIVNKDDIKISKNLLVDYFVTLKSTEYEDGFKQYEIAYKDIR